MEMVTNTSTQTQNKRQVPELSLRDFTHGTKEQRQKFIDDFFLGLKDYGFINLRDHGIDTALFKKAYELSEKFFSLPTETKKKYSGIQGGARGYTPFGQEHAKDSPVKDLKEFWHVGRDPIANDPHSGYFIPNVWPEEVAGFRDIFEKMYNDLDKMGFELLKALTYPLEVPEDYFDKLAGNGNSILRLLHYPPIPEGEDPRCIRAAAHEDINLITFLVGATASGLQIKDRDGQWLDVDTAPHLITVDSGDMLARITNDVIPATTHRVVNPIGPNTSRYSMPFFMHPHPEAILECIPSCRGAGEKYPPIREHDYLMQRLREIGLIK